MRTDGALHTFLSKQRKDSDRYHVYFNVAIVIISLKMGFMDVRESSCDNSLNGMPLLESGCVRSLVQIPPSSMNHLFDMISFL